MQRIHKILLPFLCLAFLAGCAQSMTQRANMLDAMNGKLPQLNYTRTYITTLFGYPSSQTVSVADGVTTEVWVYKTRLTDRDPVITMRRAGKERRMTITMVNTIVTDVSFE
ncbi:MAG: hypothetical protein PHX20_07775 [Candidatus Omnitrophica bacterium]|nr:hypothetical protein [Candidatus Omnitrophota bacterium]